MDKNTKAIEALRNVLNEEKQPKKRITLDEMIYNDEYEDFEEEVPSFNSAEENQPEDIENVQDKNAPIEKDLPSERTSDPEIMNILSNIRLAVINGLGKLAKKPDTVEYDTLKKILQIVDKPIDVANRDK